jgi:hypothetical protein
MNEQWWKKYLDFRLYIAFIFLISYCIDLIYFSVDDDFDCCREICGSLLSFLKVNYFSNVKNICKSQNYRAKLISAHPSERGVAYLSLGRA